jgi:hypothetical protein
LTSYVNEINNNENFKDVELRFPLSEYAGNISSIEHINILKKNDNDIFTKTNLLKDHLNVLKSDELSKAIFDMYDCKNIKNILIDAMSWTKLQITYFIKYVTKNKIQHDVMSNINFNELVKKAHANNNLYEVTTILSDMYKNGHTDVIIDSENNTIFHALADNHITNISSVIDIIKTNVDITKITNNSGCTLLDYIERSVNDTQKYNLDKLSTNYNIYNTVKHICSLGNNEQIIETDNECEFGFTNLNFKSKFN